MDESDFTKAAFEPHHRTTLLDALHADPVLVARARTRVAKLAEMHQRGQVFDRDAISRMTHDTLVKLLAQVDAAKAQDHEVTIE